MSERQISHRICTLCEAGCGVEIEVQGQQVTAVRPDREDFFSEGFVCPKSTALADVHHDSDRVRRPLRKTPGGDFEEIDWDEALDLAAGRLAEIRDRDGGDAVAAYYGNPIIHNDGALLLRGALSSALRTRNVFGASSQDTSPRFATSYYLYGNTFAVPLPDLDRTDYFLCIGANPIVSNGSALTAPNMRARLRAIRERGGTVVVVDPRHTETAREADEHVAILPGGDASLLLAMCAVLTREGRESRFAQRLPGWEGVERRLRTLDLDAASADCGVPRETIVRLAMDFANATTSAAYSRVGVCNSRHGTLATFATDLLNLIAGRLGAAGGSLFPNPALDIGRSAALVGANGHDRWRSRVRDLPETLGELPSVGLADEIETPGDGRVRGLLTFAGNPVLSIPNGRRLAKALESLEFMVSIDIYLNETTRHADLILPPAWALAESHVDVFFPAFSIRNRARYSPPAVAREPGELADWEIMKALCERLGGGPSGIRAVDRTIAWGERLGFRWTPEKILDLMLRVGPHGDRFLPGHPGLSMAKLRKAERGVDLGPLQTGIRHRLFHRDGRVHLDAAPLLADFDTLLGELARPRAPEAERPLLLVGRRELRSNNSWLHNVPRMMSGKDRCVLWVHPEDAQAAGVEDGDTVLLESRTHSGPVPIALNDELRPGVLSLPHGYGHAELDRFQKVAAENAGVSFNDWSDEQRCEPVVGQSILNGVPVRIRALA